MTRKGRGYVGVMPKKENKRKRREKVTRKTGRQQQRMIAMGADLSTWPDINEPKRPRALL